MKRIPPETLFVLAALCFLSTSQLLSQSSTQPGKVRTTYQSRGVTFAYPENWRVLDEKDGDVWIGSTSYETIIGPNGTVPVSNEAIGFGFYDANARDLRGAAYELLGRFRRRYPYLKYLELAAGAKSSEIINGQEFLLIGATDEFLSENISRDPYGEQRRGVLFVAKDNGLFWYWLFAVKPDELEIYQGTIEAVMNTVKFPKSSSGRSRLPSTATPATDVPAKPLVLTSQEIAKKAFPSVVMLVTKDSKGHLLSIGNGFVVKENFIVTNLHVWSGAKEAVAKFVGQDEYYRITGVAARDAAHDLVLLRIDAQSAPALPLAKCNDIAIGDRIYAVGNPQGLEGTFSEGIVSAVRDSPDEQFVQITAPISHGSSGGPVLNVRGEVVGVSTATLKGGQNLNFAISSCYLNTLLSSASTRPVTQ